jgi:histidinol-phosphate aminotransferase
MRPAELTSAPEVPFVRPEIRAIRAYRLKQPSGAIRLHQNEAPGDWPDAVKREVVEGLLAVPWHRYPHARADAVCDALGQMQGTPRSMIAATAGSNEALWATFAAAAAGGTVVMPNPTYSMARTLALAAGARVVEVPLGPGFALDAGAVLRAAHVHRAEAIYLASPNNPTGNVLEREAVGTVLAGAPGAVVLDEAYWEFTGATWLDAARSHAHVMLVRTFSKAMAGAGLRVGWITAQEHVIAELLKVLPPYSLNVFAQVATPVLVAHRRIAEERVCMIAAERARVAGGLRALGASVFASETNFLLFESGFAPAAVWERLAELGVLVRDVSSAPRLSGCLRVSIGAPDDNDRFLTAMAATLAGLRGALREGGGRQD